MSTADALIAVTSGLAQLLRSCYGPLGKEKVITGADQTVFCSKSGAAILENLAIQHPAGALVVRAAQNQQNSCGDGTIALVLLIAYWFREAHRLMRESASGSGACSPAEVQAGLADAVEYACRELETLVEVPQAFCLPVAIDGDVASGVDDAQQDRCAATLGAPLPAEPLPLPHPFAFHLAYAQTCTKCSASIAAELAHLCARAGSAFVHARSAPGRARLVPGLLLDLPTALPPTCARMLANVWLLVAVTAGTPSGAEPQRAGAEEATSVADLNALQRVHIDAAAAAAAAVRACGAQLVLCGGAVSGALLSACGRFGVPVVGAVPSGTLRAVCAAFGARPVPSLLAEPVPTDAVLGRVPRITVERVGLQDLLVLHYHHADADQTGPAVPAAAAATATVEHSAAPAIDARHPTLLLRAVSPAVLSGRRLACTRALTALAHVRGTEGDRRLVRGAGAAELRVAARLRAHALHRAAGVADAWRVCAAGLEHVAAALLSPWGRNLRPPVDATDCAADVRVGEWTAAGRVCVPDLLITKVHAWRAALETVTLLLRIDAIVSASDLRLLSGRAADEAGTRPARAAPPIPRVDAAADRAEPEGTGPQRPQQHHAEQTARLTDAPGAEPAEAEEPWRYRRPRRRVQPDRGWTEDERRRHQRREQWFYSAEQRERRARLDAKALRYVPSTRAGTVVAPLPSQ